MAGKRALSSLGKWASECHQIELHKDKYRITITNGGSTARHSKALSELDRQMVWILFKKILLALLVTLVLYEDKGKASSFYNKYQFVQFTEVAVVDCTACLKSR